MSDFTEKPRMKRGIAKCPLNDMTDCADVCHECMLWTGIQYKEDATQQIKEVWQCAIVGIATAQRDVVRMAASTAKATEQMRDEVIKRSVSPPMWAIPGIVQHALNSAGEQLSLDMDERRQIENLNG